MQIKWSDCESRCVTDPEDGEKAPGSPAGGWGLVLTKCR